MSNFKKPNDMKKMMTLAMMMTIAISAAAMTYNEARNEALFLSDKMAYELNLSEAQYEAVYEINLDYLMSINPRADVYGAWWNVRNRDLQMVLSPAQFARYAAIHYFYRPVAWNGHAWAYGIYSHYDRSRFFRHHPAVYVSYRGGHNRGHVSHYAAHFGRPATHVVPRPIHHADRRYDSHRPGDRYHADRHHADRRYDHRR